MYSLLIVDDEPIMRRGIKLLIDLKALSINEVYEASNGREALDLFIDREPDIIIADINMPKIDGLQLAKEIKTRNKHAHIAIITGYEYFEYAQAALKVGVDDFVLKPVSKEDIRQLLQKIVTQIREDEANENALKSLKNISTMIGKSEDTGYRNVILETMNKNLSNPDFSLALLADAVNLSSGHLSAVFKKIFGIPFNEYIVVMRLERAKILILTTEYKIYEIAEMTGFDDPNYFSTSFKKKFGISPNKFRNSVGGENK